MPAIPVLRRLDEAEKMQVHKFEATLGYIILEKSELYNKTL